MPHHDTHVMHMTETTQTDKALRQQSLFDYEQQSGPECRLNDDTLADVEQIETWLLNTIDDVGYVKSRDIAAGTDLKVSTVGSLIHDLDRLSAQVEITEWARTNATTWYVEVHDV